LAHLRRRLDESPTILFELLPERFTLSELQALAEAVLGEPLDRRNFRRKLKERDDLLVPAEGTRRQGRHRPAQLYRFVRPRSDLHPPVRPPQVLLRPRVLALLAERYAEPLLGGGGPVTLVGDLGQDVNGLAEQVHCLVGLAALRARLAEHDEGQANVPAPR